MFKKILTKGIASALVLATMALPAFADNEETVAPTGNATVSAADLTCMATAVDKRELAIQAALDVYYNGVKTALTTRHAALKAAWTLTDKAARKEAIKAAWAAFKGTWKRAEKQLDKARRAAWRQFNKDRKACGAASTEEPQGEM